jgi:hypothetical protein
MEPLVFMRHIRQIRKSDGNIVCMSGVRAWCQRHDISVADLIRVGVPGERFVEIDDHYAHEILANARNEAAE